MKAAIYCRLSDEDRDKPQNTDDSASIQNQKAMLLQYAIAQGWAVYDVYSDDDYAGADRNRPQFNRLLEDAKARRFDIVLCKTQSRFTRELELVEKYLHGLFPLWGIRFVSIVDNADTANKGNKKSRQINGLVNEWYLEDMSENIKSVLNNRRENGLHIGSFALYGYRKDPDKKGRLIIDAPAAAVVREVFALYASGMGKTAIARLLNARSIPNPTEYKRQQGLRYMQPQRREATLWKYASISNMLANEIYIGNMVQGRCGSISYKTKQNRPRPKAQWIRAERTHEPIIERDLWERVQHLRVQRARPFANGTLGLFARKTKCMCCGYHLRASKSHGLRYLRCATRHAANDACIGASVPENALHEIVLRELKQEIETHAKPDFIAAMLQPAPQNNAELERRKRARNACAQRLQTYTAALSKAYLESVAGIIDASTFAELARTLQADKQALEQNARALDRTIAELTRRIPSPQSDQSMVRSYLEIAQLTRPLVDKLIDYIEIGRRDAKSKQPPIIIHWNF